MKQRTVTNIITAAEREGLVCPPNEQEVWLLTLFSNALCPESKELLLESYRLRKLGLCTLLLSLDYTPSVLNKRHTETGYRIIGVTEAYVEHGYEHLVNKGSIIS